MMAVDHFENCIDSADKVIKFIEKLREDLPAPTHPMGHLDLPAEDDMARRLRDFRNALGHHYTQVLDRSGTRGHLAYIGVLEDRLELGTNKVTYHELAAWLRQIHASVGRLIEAPDVLNGTTV